jgi:hypothetical protein
VRAVLADTMVLWRTTGDSFAITGWGWLALLLVLASIEKIGRRGR